MAEADSLPDGGVPGDLTVSVTGSGVGTVIVHVSGDLDMVTAPTLAAYVRRQLDDTLRSLVIDLSGVTFLGSAGLAVLAEAHRATQGRSIGMRVVASSRMVLRPLQVTGLDTLLTIVTDVD